MMRQRTMFQMKQDKTQGGRGGGGNPNETEVRNLPDKEFKVMTIKILTELQIRMEEHSENFNRVRK